LSQSGHPFLRQAGLVARSFNQLVGSFIAATPPQTIQWLERHTGITIEPLAFFVRLLLTITRPLPPDAQASAQTKRRQ
jgi:hypothetical protein